MTYLDRLKGSSLFLDIDGRELAALAPLFQERMLGEGATVFVEQMPGESLYLICEGTVRITKMLAEGEEQILVILGPEDVFGEMAVLDGGPRSATARVAERARLLAIKKKDFEGLCASQPELGMKLMRNIVRLLSQRIRETNDEYRQMLFWSLGRKNVRT